MLNAKQTIRLSVVVIILSLVIGCKHYVDYTTNDSGAHWKVAYPGPKDTR